MGSSPTNQICPVCEVGFETFADHARCDGCFLAVHFTDCSGYQTVERDGDQHLYIFCFFCYSPVEDTYEGEDGYWHPVSNSPNIVDDDFDWDELDDMMRDSGLDDEIWDD